MCNQDDNDTRNAKDTDNKRLEEGDLDACAKQIDDPQDNSTNDAVCDERPQDTERNGRAITFPRIANNTMPTARATIISISDFPPIFHCTRKSYLVRVFQISSDGQAVCDARNTDPHGL